MGAEREVGGFEEVKEEEEEEGSEIGNKCKLGFYLFKLKVATSELDDPRGTLKNLRVFLRTRKHRGGSAWEDV